MVCKFFFIWGCLMKWFTAALFSSGVKIRPNSSVDNAVQGPFESDRQRDTAIRRFRHESKSDGVVAIIVPFDVAGDEEFVEVGDLIASE